MATREKKTTTNKKANISSPVLSKEETTTTATTLVEAEANNDEKSSENNLSTSGTTKTTSLVKKLEKPKRVAKKPTMTLKLKSKIKRNIQVKQKFIKAFLNNTNTESKKKLLKNGVRPIGRPRLKKNEQLLTSPVLTPQSVEQPEQLEQQQDDEDNKKNDNDQPPVLEPIFPINENINKTPKKGSRRPPSLKKSDAEPKPKRVYKRKKPPVETIDQVMNDLSTLIKTGEVKEENNVIGSEFNKIDTPSKTKKVFRRRRRENIENTVTKFGPDEQKVIDMLDLNVEKIKNNEKNEETTTTTTTKRRHSIEKFPIGVNIENENNSVFNNLPRSISPRSKNVNKIRQSIDRRVNPYKTRSDSPARILRNGKHRKLKDIELLDGLEAVHRKRKRQCSDYSGSEMSISKFSGYESDSSFSDLSSVHGCNENQESKDIDSVKNEIDEQPIIEPDINIKRRLSSDNIDNNSNCFNINLNKENSEIEIAKIKQENTIEISDGTALMVPEKDLILDIMKQTFNDVFAENDKETKAKAKSKSEILSTANFLENDIQQKQQQQQQQQQQDVVDEIEAVTEESKENLQLINNTEEYKQEIKDDELINATDIKIENNEIKETPENLAIKENILQALGLQSLKAAQEAIRSKNKEKISTRNNDSTNYSTGTLKTVIKINRDKKRRNTIKMTLHKNKDKSKNVDCDGSGPDDKYKVLKDVNSTSWKHGSQSSDTAGAQRKSHYFNRSNMDGSSEHTSDGEAGSMEGELLVIPEKASSFSIHPGRLCKDECSYCFGKFGLFDTPCHIAQMKSVERQDKILSVEVHLTRDSCLCDACYRHVDRKSNTPSYGNRLFKRSSLVAPGPKQDQCHVLGCSREASNILRRKWIIKMKKSICQVINLDLDNPGLHSIPICDEHYSALEHLMVCAMCKRRLAKNHILYLGPEVDDLNKALENEGIPLGLSDKPVVCRLCKCFATIILKDVADRPGNSNNFFMEYKKRLLHFNDIVPMDEAAAEEPIIVPTREKMEQARKKKKVINKNQQQNDSTQQQQQSSSTTSKNATTTATTTTTTTTNTNTISNNSEPSSPQIETENNIDQNRVPSTDSIINQSRPESPNDYMIDYNTLIPSIAMECESDTESKKTETIKRPQSKKIIRPESVKQAVEISKNIKYNKNNSNSTIAVQRLGSNPSISVRQLFPCEEDLPLYGHIDFGNVKERTPEGWEKCCSIIQYDMETKLLWQELQKPYGNQSSFLRHLILLEKYFRNGDLILAPGASHHSVNYSESINNRLRAFDNIPTFSSRAQKSNSGIITSTNIKYDNSISIYSKTPTPITLSHLNSPPLIPTTVPAAIKQKQIGAPPGLISLQPGTNRPMTPLVKPQSQKIKFPITKNWRPNLIPIDPNKKTPERKQGLVQVISGGKPFHITLEDYKKMCAIKKSFELRQKRLQDAAKQQQQQQQQQQQYLLLQQQQQQQYQQQQYQQQQQQQQQLKLQTTRIFQPILPKTIPKSSTSPKRDDIETENIINKLDKQVEKLETKLNETKSSLILPKIPKSLTVIPQTVTRKPSRPSSPVLLITQKPKLTNNNKS